ncbi:MAG: phosphoenolpyruvate--protein phosphotransferase [Treponema sp.]|jgi:phosphotransferase system enzyme I (PtsI)|nr:phosphoenolpyruvate--protein phosphotransferase [Treponema sp.]
MILNGKSAAPGFAVGNVYIYNNNSKTPVENFISAGDIQSHLDHYEQVKTLALTALDKLRLSMQKHDPEKALIFFAHQEIVDDVIINEEIPARITNDLWSGDWAIYQVYETVLAVLRKTADPLIAERASDFDDVRALLLQLWYGEENEKRAFLTEPVIIAGREILPSFAADLDTDKVLAIITEKGGETSHAAIIAKSFGIPTVLGMQGLLKSVKQGQKVAVNADEGFVILDPLEETAAEYAKKSETYKREKAETEIYLDKEALTACGARIDIGLNIANAGSDLRLAERTDSVGVFRTEYLYMGRDTLPSEEEQFSAYRKVLETYGKRPVILRTLDIGGDKNLSSTNIPREENPFLGTRALRLCFDYPEIFKTQLRAALRSSVYGNLWLMLPMVGSIDDIRRANEIITAVKKELEDEGTPASDFKTGIMIEIPSIALISGAAAKEVDFASIGTNDLCQYLCAADRMNSAVEEYYQSYHPALFSLIKDTVSAFTNAGKPISICGELGSDIKAIPLLIGLGLRKLSMSSASIAAVKRAISQITLKQCESLAAKALECATASEIKELL